VLKKLKEENLNAVTFESAANAYIEAHGDTWKNPKHRAQWSATLATYAFPVIGSLQTAHVTQAHVLAVLEPIWKTKNETAARLRGRIEGTRLGYRSRVSRRRESGPLEGAVGQLLPAPGKIQKTVHRKALTIDAVQQFMRDLRDKEGVAARALEFVVLTAARSGEVRGVT
jgi:integrase